ncbi:MAG: metallopeptidase family protein [Holosporales bacterium]|jgi:predicted Zn-dependent protease with MMP-like domain|nr:metallopeptidase family protein [Holosporales bacterium]
MMLGKKAIRTRFLNTFASIMTVYSSYCGTNMTSQIFDVPCIKQIKEYATNALFCCPAKIRGTLNDTEIVVENFAPVDVLSELRVKNKNELLGLYKMQNENNTKSLILYRGPLVLYAGSSNESVSNVVARVTVYEISHRANCVSLRKQWLDKIRRL